MFLNISPSVTHQPPLPPTTRASVPGAPLPTNLIPGSYFTLTLDENPLAEFVELPEAAIEGGLWYSNVLCGVLRGALEMVSPFHTNTPPPFRWIWNISSCMERYYLTQVYSCGRLISGSNASRSELPF